MLASLKSTYVTLGQQWRSQRQRLRNRQSVQAHAQPGLAFFATELMRLLPCDAQWLDATALEYARCPRAWQLLSGLRSGSRRTDGYAKSLDVAEGFALWSLVKFFRPQTVVEIGSQYGISARVWKEALATYVPNHRLFLCDLADNRRFIHDDECTFLPGDARQTLKPLLAAREIDLLYNDAHPYDLIRWSVEAAQTQDVPIFAFHDVGGHQLRGGPFRPISGQASAAEKTQYNESYGPFGTWERLVMAELFGQEILAQDYVVTSDWRMQIFDSLFGFGVALRLPAKGSA